MLASLTCSTAEGIRGNLLLALSLFHTPEHFHLHHLWDMLALFYSVSWLISSGQERSLKLLSELKNCI